MGRPPHPGNRGTECCQGVSKLAKLDIQGSMPWQFSPQMDTSVTFTRCQWVVILLRSLEERNFSEIPAQLN